MKNSIKIKNIFNSKLYFFFHEKIFEQNQAFNSINIITFIVSQFILGLN